MRRPRWLERRRSRSIVIRSRDLVNLDIVIDGEKMRVVSYESSTNMWDGGMRVHITLMAEADFKRENEVR